MINNLINKLVSKFKKYNIDGYIIPKNDEFFSEYSANDRLKTISNFSGSAGYSIILKNKNYLFVDGRYTIQAKKEAGKTFQIVDFHKIINCNLFKNLSIGFDPKFFTSKQIKKFFNKNNKIKSIESNLIDQIHKNKVKSSKPFFSLKNKIVGEDYKNKIIKIKKYLKKNKSDYLFITAPEKLSQLFPELNSQLKYKNCKFRNCLHMDEPGCGISKEWERYTEYKKFLEEMLNYHY